MHIQYIYIYTYTCVFMHTCILFRLCICLCLCICICTWVWICWIWTCLRQCINIYYIMQMLFYSYSIYWVWSSYNEIWWRDPKSLFFEVPFLAFPGWWNFLCVWPFLHHAYICMYTYDASLYQYLYIWKHMEFREYEWRHSENIYLSLDIWRTIINFSFGCEHLISPFHLYSKTQRLFV